MYPKKWKLTAATLLALGAVGWSAHMPAAEAPAPPEKPKAVRPEANLKLRDHLMETVKVTGYDDPKTTLAEVLEQFESKFDLKWSVNERAFKFENVTDVLKSPVADPNPIPKMETALNTVIKRILARIPAQSGATYLIRGDHIEITTVQAVRTELNLPFIEVEDGTPKELAKVLTPLPPLVYEEFEDEPWNAAVQGMARRGRVNIAVDPQALEKTREIRVTARLHNVPAEAAARTLASMADLTVVPLNNVLYITTREKAALLAGPVPPPPAAATPVKPAEVEKKSK